MKLTVSVPTFNEIAGELEKHGIKLSEGKIITLEKGTALVPPIDYRLVTIRRDILIEAVKLTHENEINDTNISEFIDTVDKLYQYVLKEIKPETKSNDWK